jgi:hypothetical protein
MDCSTAILDVWRKWDSGKCYDTNAKPSLPIDDAYIEDYEKINEKYQQLSEIQDKVSEELGLGEFRYVPTKNLPRYHALATRLEQL